MDPERCQNEPRDLLKLGSNLAGVFFDFPWKNPGLKISQSQAFKMAREGCVITETAQFYHFT